MTGYKACGYLCCAGGAALVLAAWFNVLGGFWFAAGLVLIVVGVLLLRIQKPRPDALDAVDIIEIGVDLLD
jgi:membrane-bound ClpP family serine protease